MLDIAGLRSGRDLVGERLVAQREVERRMLDRLTWQRLTHDHRSPQTVDFLFASGGSGSTVPRANA
jgi:hypothetical protein